MRATFLAFAVWSIACAPRAMVLPGDGVTYGWIQPRPLCSLNERVGSAKVPASFRNTTLQVSFVVRKDGRVEGIEVSPDVGREIAEPIRSAIASCGWVPGRNPAGVPASIRLLVPVRFQADAGTPRPRSTAPADLPDPSQVSGG